MARRPGRLSRALHSVLRVDRLGEFLRAIQDYFVIGYYAMCLIYVMIDNSV